MIPRTPSNVVIQVTKRCNLLCSHCYSVYDKKVKLEDLPIEVIKGLITDLNLLEVKAITLLGGEPFMRKDLFEIIDFCIEKSIRPEIVTNGTFLNETILKKVLSHGVKRLAFSIDGLSFEHNKIRGNGTFEKTANAIKLAKKLGFHIRIITVVTKINKDSINGLVKLLQGEVDIHKMIYFTPFGYGDMKDWLGSIEWLKFIDEVKSNYEDNRHTEVFLQQPYLTKPVKNICQLKSIFIGADGNVYPCVLFLDTDYSVGNISSERFISIWQKEWKLKRTYNHCVGYSHIFNNDISIPVEKTHDFGGYHLGCTLQCNKEKPENIGNLHIY